MILNSFVKIVSSAPGDNGSQVWTLFSQVWGKPALNFKGKPSFSHLGKPVLDRFGKPEGRWEFNITVTVYPSKGVWVTVKDNNKPTVRPTKGILDGMKITDGTAVKSAVGEMAVRWLSQHKYGNLLRFPDLTKFMQHPEYDACTNCRWHRKARMGSDEMDMDLSDDSGICLRDMERWDGAYNPEHVCILFGVWLEDQFGLIPELNRIIEGGMVGGRLVNIAAGWGVEPVWRSLRDLVNDEISAKSCMFHRQGTWTAERGWDTTHVCTVKHQGAMARRLEGRGPRKAWEDIIPIGWLPRVGTGIMIPGGIELQCDTINLQQEVPNVQPSKQARPGQLPGRDPGGEQGIQPSKLLEAVNFAEEL